MDNIWNLVEKFNNEDEEKALEEGKVVTDKDTEQAQKKKLVEQDDEEKEIEDEPDVSDRPPVDTEDDVEQDADDKEAPEIGKEYLGKTEDTHFYMVSEQADSGEVEDLQIVDQEGVKKYSAKENNLEASDVSQFIVAALQELDISEIDRGVFMKYLLPMLIEEEEEPEEELEPEMEEEEAVESKNESKLNEGVFAPYSNVATSTIVDWLVANDKTNSDITNLIKDESGRPAKDKILSYVVNAVDLNTTHETDLGTDLLKTFIKNVDWGEIAKNWPETSKSVRDTDESINESNKLFEMEIDDGEHTFDVYLVDDGTADTVISINGREFRFDGEFASFWRDEDGSLSEEGLRELALDALSNMEAEEYDELIARGEIDDAEEVASEEDVAPETPAVESKVEEKDALKGGLGDNNTASTFDAEQLKRGIEVEMEHTDNPKIAEEIAEDHLTEDPQYYTKLDKMEAGACDEDVDEKCGDKHKKDKKTKMKESEIEEKIEDDNNENRGPCPKCGENNWVEVKRQPEYEDDLPQGVYCGNCGYKLKESEVEEDKVMDKSKETDKPLDEADISKGVKELTKAAKAAINNGDYIKAAELSQKLATIQQVVPPEVEQAAETPKDEEDKEDKTPPKPPAPDDTPPVEDADEQSDEDKEKDLDEAEAKAKTKTKKKDPKAKTRNRGDVVFAAGSKDVKDDKDHFPINDKGRARNALARANQYKESPEWYNGSLKSLVTKVAKAVKAKYPDIEVSKKAKKPGKESIEVEKDKTTLEESTSLGYLKSLLEMNRN